MSGRGSDPGDGPGGHPDVPAGTVTGTDDPGAEAVAYVRIAESFHRRIECIAGAVDVLAAGIQGAASLLTRAVLEDRKVLVCASGADAALAAFAARALRDGAPGLPAVSVSCDDGGDADAILWRDLRTLSRDGDVLLCLDSHPGAPLARACAGFAATRNLALITLSEPLDGAAHTAVELLADSSEQRIELLLMACHCLQVEIRHLLLGE